MTTGNAGFRKFPAIEAIEAMGDLRFVEQHRHCGVSRASDIMSGPTKGSRRDDYHLARPGNKNGLAALTNEQHQKLCYWMLRTKLTYPDIVDMIKEDWGFSVTIMMLSDYYRDNVAQYLITQRQRNIDVVTEVNSDLAKNPAEFVPASLDSLKRMAWRLANDPSPDPKAIKIVFELVLRFGEQEIKRQSIAVKLRKLYMLERKAAAAEDAARNTKISDSEFADKMRTIFKVNALPQGSKNGHTQTEETSERNAVTT